MEDQFLPVMLHRKMNYLTFDCVNAPCSTSWHGLSFKREKQEHTGSLQQHWYLVTPFQPLIDVRLDQHVLVLISASALLMLRLV